MTRTQLLQELRRMRFQEAYGGWQERRLTQEEAARLLGVCERTFRRYVDRYEDEGLDGLLDKRLGEVSARRAPVDEVLRTEALYRERYEGWNVKHFYSFYRRRHTGTRSYTWVKNTLQRAGLVAKAPGRGKHRRRRERAPLVGMMVHQDGSTHEWVPGQHWDLVITLDDATSEHYSMFFVEEEGTASSFQGMAEVVEGWGLPSSLYTDRGSHYWFTPEARDSSPGAGAYRSNQGPHRPEGSCAPAKRCRKGSRVELRGPLPAPDVVKPFACPQNAVSGFETVYNK